MAMKISVGLQKKVGQPNFGSLGASCHVEFEIDPSLVESNLDGFHIQGQRGVPGLQAGGKRPTAAAGEFEGR